MFHAILSKMKNLTAPLPQSEVPANFKKQDKPRFGVTQELSALVLTEALHHCGEIAFATHSTGWTFSTSKPRLHSHKQLEARQYEKSARTQ
jgi:hypothetical protein